MFFPESVKVQILRSSLGMVVVADLGEEQKCFHYYRKDDNNGMPALGHLVSGNNVQAEIKGTY